MNLRSIALALVVTSPSLLACADNIRKARELRPPRGAPGPQQQPSRTQSQGSSEEESPTTETPTTTETPPTTEAKKRTSPVERFPVTASATPEISSTPPNDTRTKKPASGPGISSVETSSHKSPSSPTNDCITFPITDPWEFDFEGFPQSCQTYDRKYQPWNNYDYCNEDVGTDGVLAKDACPQCGQCLGPENTCVAFGKNDPFDADYGECRSYKKNLENHPFCGEDKYKGIKAFQACPECGKCVESSPRTVKISVRFIQALERGDDSTDKLEIIGYLGSQLDRRKHRKFWEKKLPEYQDIFKGKKFYLEKTHYYYDVGDWEYISAKGELSEYDFVNGVDPLFAKIESFNVGKLYHKGTTQIVQVIWLDRRGNKIQAFYNIDVY